MRTAILFLAAAMLAGGCGSGGGSGPGVATSTGTSVGTSTGSSTGTSTGTSTGVAPAGEGRALWVTRWAADTQAEVKKAIDYAVAQNLNMVLLQVYADGAALYPSAVAPRNSLTAGSGFDPLAYAVPYARGKGVQIHAWLNVCRVYTGGTGAPSSPQHILNLHPEYAVVTSGGLKHTDLYTQTGTEIHACAEWQGFQDYCVAVAREIVTSYEVDGVHLDYIRLASGTNVCWCSEHQRKFQARYGRAPTASDPDWSAFRYETITNLVAAIHDAMAQARPRALLSATKTSFFSHQDARGWFRRGKLDILFPMIYTGDVAAFEAAARGFEWDADGRHVMPGIDVAESVFGDEIDITRRIGSEGFALFSSSGLTAAQDPVLAARFPSPKPVPACPWKDGTADAKPPAVTVPTATPGEDVAVVEWTSDERSAARVEIWPTAAGPGSATAFAGAAGLGWDHRVSVTGLSAGTSYTFHVVSTDASGNWRSSADATFTTLAAGTTLVTVDDGDAAYGETGSWFTGTSQGGSAGDYRYASRAAIESATATWRPVLPRAGRYRVSVWYVAGANRVTDAKFTIAHRSGMAIAVVNQQTGGGAWRDLGTFSFDGAAAAGVSLSNAASGTGVVVADAIRFEYVGP